MMTRAFLVTCGMIIFSASLSAVPVVVESFRLSEVDPNVNLQTAQKLGKAKAYKTFKITWGTKTEAACKAQCTCKPPNKGGPKWCKSSIGPMSAGGCKKGVKLCRKPCKRYRFTANTKTCELFTYGTEGKGIKPTPKPTPKKTLSCCTSDVISGAKRCGSAAAARSCATRLANCKKYPYMNGAVRDIRQAFSLGCDKFLGRGKSACLQECRSTCGPWGLEELHACENGCFWMSCDGSKGHGGLGIGGNGFSGSIGDAKRGCNCVHPVYKPPSNSWDAPDMKTCK